MVNPSRHLAVVTGASSGIGYELARQCASNGFDLIVAADEPRIHQAAAELGALNVDVKAVEADLSTPQGVEKLVDAIAAWGRPVDALLANAGRGLGHAFLDQDDDAWRKVIDTNVTGTLDLIQRVGNDMKRRRQGRILITGSIAGFLPGAYQAVYNGTKAFLDSFSFALRNELKDSGVTVTCLMPGVTETDFFERADMMDTKVGTSGGADPAKVAKDGFAAMMSGKGEVVSGWMNKVQTAIASLAPKSMTAEQHRKMAAPGRAK